MKRSNNVSSLSWLAGSHVEDAKEEVQLRDNFRKFAVNMENNILILKTEIASFHGDDDSEKKEQTTEVY